MFLCSTCREMLNVSGRHVTRLGGKRILAELNGHWRTISFLPSMAEKLTSAPERRKDYREEKILGYTQEQVYNVIADVDSYHSFLPWCQESTYTGSKHHATLAIGFPPLVERYTALVVADPHYSLKTMSTDGKLFTKLENSWYFRQGPDLESGPTCLVNFRVTFEFRSLIYAQLGFLVFDEVARTMAGAFMARCAQLYGPDHLDGLGIRGIQGLKRLLEESKSRQIQRQGGLMEID